MHDGMMMYCEWLSGQCKWTWLGDCFCNCGFTTDSKSMFSSLAMVVF